MKKQELLFLGGLSAMMIGYIYDIPIMIGAGGMAFVVAVALWLDEPV